MDKQMAFGVAMKFNSLPKEGEPLNIIMRPPLEGEEAIVSAGISKGKVNEFTNTNRSVTIEMEHEFFASHAKEANSAFWIIAIGNDDADDIGRPIGVSSIDGIKDGRGGSGCIIFDTDMWGKGIASACHRARCFYAYSRLGLRAIDSTVAYPNTGSYKALLGVGYTVTGTLYSLHFRGGKWHHLHSLTWVNPDKYKWDEFWCNNKPPKKFVVARKKAEATLEWAKQNITFL
jgi:RimJ/RimL family protein N-acetyltransferase